MIAFYDHVPYLGGKVCIKSCQNLSHCAEITPSPKTLLTS
jgi:hypothetical protein